MYYIHNASINSPKRNVLLLNNVDSVQENLILFNLLPSNICLFFFFQKSYFQVKQCVYTHSKTAILWSQAEILLSSNELIRILVQLMHDENQAVVEIQYKKKKHT